VLFRSGAEYKTAAGTEHQLDRGIKVTFFDSEGTLTTTVTAVKAKIHENQDIEVLGNVILVSKLNTVIKTDYARWTASDSMIRSGSPVSISRPGEIINGRGFETDQALTRYRIFQGSGEAVINK
ncbi:MAG: LPS export ABC transporter periplasmic protein LptC, partial [Chlorobiaceae bacterium]|nr:LPS export ABC transporter periplasmic protein LptC [Chlorobiaceae bacterium]